MGTVVVSVGIDIGQSRDPTALVITEAERVLLTPGQGWRVPKSQGIVKSEHIRYDPGVYETVYTVRDLGRLPLGTSYPKVAEHIQNVVAALAERGIWQPLLYVDATGVGMPVVDLLSEGLRRTNARLCACTFTHGDKLTLGSNGHTASVGKAFLVSRLQAMLQSQRLKMPKNTESEALARELMDYEIKVDNNANDTYGAFKVGTHDDLVTALGLSILVDAIKERDRRIVHSFE